MHSREFERLKIKGYGQRLPSRVYMGGGGSGLWPPVQNTILSRDF